LNYYSPTPTHGTSINVTDVQTDDLR